MASLDSKLTRTPVSEESSELKRDLREPEEWMRAWEGGVYPKMRVDLGKNSEEDSLMMRVLCEEGGITLKWQAMIRDSFWDDLLIPRRMDVKMKRVKLTSLMNRGTVSIKDGRMSLSYSDSDLSTQLSSSLELRSLQLSKDEVISDLRRRLDEMMDMEQEMQLLKEESREKDELIARLTEDIAEEVRKREELATENRRLKEEIEGLKRGRKEVRKSEEEKKEVVPKVDLDDEVMTILGELTIEEMIREDHPDELDALAGHLGWDKGGERDAEGRALFLVLLSDPNPLAILHSKYLFTHRSEVKADEKYKNGCITYNALEICAENPHLTGMLEWLLREGSVDPSDNGPLSLAIIRGNIPVIKLLFDDPRVDKDGYWAYKTPLIWAAHCNKPSVVSLLLENGCDPGKKHEESGLTALDIATKKGHSEVIAILEAAGAPRSRSE